MNRPHLLIVAASLALIQPAFAVAAAPAAALEASNPFAKVSTLPFHYPAFDKIKDEHFLPAYAAGMREQLREIDGIANNPKPATFDNTIVAMERSGQLLTRVATTFSNLQGANTNDKLDEIDREMSPKLAAHNDAIFLNAKLYAARQVAVRQARQAGPRRRVGLPARALQQGLRARRRPPVGCRQGQAEGASTAKSPPCKPPSPRTC